MYVNSPKRLASTPDDVFRTISVLRSACYCKIWCITSQLGQRHKKKFFRYLKKISIRLYLTAGLMFSPNRRGRILGELANRYYDFLRGITGKGPVPLLRHLSVPKSENSRINSSTNSHVLLKHRTRQNKRIL